MCRIGSRKSFFVENVRNRKLLNYDGPSKPLLHKLEWNSIQELIADETQMMVFKSINDFGQKYMYKIFTRTSHLIHRVLRNTTTDLRLPWDRKTSHTGVPRCGIAYQLNAKKHDHYLSLNPF